MSHQKMCLIGKDACLAKPSPLIWIQTENFIYLRKIKSN